VSRFLVIGTLTLTVGVTWLGSGRGDEVVPPFRGSIERMATARAEIMSFDVILSAVNAPQEVAKPVDGDRELAEYRARLAIEGPTRRMHVARLDILVNRADGEISDAEDSGTWTVYVDTEDFQVFGSRGTASIIDAGVSLGHLPRVFDPRSLGAAFCGDLAERASAEKVFGNYLQWSDMPGTWEENGILRYADRVGSFVMRIDTQRGYWPIEVESRSGNRLESATRLELEKIGERWLPTRAVIRCPGEETSLKLEWKVVNEPLDQRLFDYQHVAAQYGLSISDQRRDSVAE
jgi:hypothetical protein